MSENNTTPVEDRYHRGNLKEILDAIGIDLDSLNGGDLHFACCKIVQVQKMPADQRRALIALATRGPLPAGEISSKTVRDALVSSHNAVRIIVKNERGYLACTEEGMITHRIIQTLSKQSIPDSPPPQTPAPIPDITIAVCSALNRLIWKIPHGDRGLNGLAEFIAGELQNESVHPVSLKWDAGAEEFMPTPAETLTPINP